MPFLQNVEFHLISDGVCRVDGGGAFGLVPRTVWEELLPPDSKNRVPFALNSLLIRSEGKNILVDTGYGQKLSPKMARLIDWQQPRGDLLASLGRLGLLAKDIDIVINTHLHLDHCGGNTQYEGDLLRPTFPNAEYYVQRLEWADALAPNERTRATYFQENYWPLKESDQLKLIDGQTSITGEVWTAVTRGHTRAHQIVIIESDGELAIFMADMATFHYHFQRLAWVTGFDVEPLESIETKRYWQQWALQHQALLIFQHDSQISTGKLYPAGQHFRVEPISLV